LPHTQTKKDRDLRYASTISYERRAREWDAEQLTQEKVLAADQRKQDEENRPKTYDTSSFSLFYLYSVCARGASTCLECLVLILSVLAQFVRELSS
jgi:hypothetical protein